MKALGRTCMGVRPLQSCTLHGRLGELLELPPAGSWAGLGWLLLSVLVLLDFCL